MVCNKMLPPKPKVYKSNLVNATIIKRFPALETETTDESMIKAHFFNPVGIGDWYVLTYDPLDKVFFGYVKLHENELGYFSLDELQNVQLPWGRKIERDIYWHDQPLKDIK